jgi:hypothetical protein
MPAAYPASNFHTENLSQFAADVDKATGGKLKITVHAGASLYKANEIKRAVQGGQAQIGEILLGQLQPMNGRCSAPTTCPSSPTATPRPPSSARCRSRCSRRSWPKQGMLMLFSVPWPPQGIFAKKPINSAADLKGVKWRAYSPQHRRASPSWSGAQPVTIQQAELSPGAWPPVWSPSFMSSGATGYDTKTYEHLKFYIRHPGLAAQERGDRQQGRLRRAGRDPAMRC